MEKEAIYHSSFITLHILLNFKFTLLRVSVQYFEIFFEGLLPKMQVEDTRLEAKTKAKDTKKLEAKAKNSPSEDRLFRGQGQECSRPRPRTMDTSTSALQIKKKVFKIFLRRSQQKNVFHKIFQALHKILTIQKIVLSSSRGQGNF